MSNKIFKNKINGYLIKVAKNKKVMEEILSHLNCIDKGASYKLDCPVCELEGGAYIYKSNLTLFCNNETCKNFKDSKSKESLRSYFIEKK